MEAGLALASDSSSGMRPTCAGAVSLPSGLCYSFAPASNAQHHALRKAPAIAEEDNIRCNICGIRYIATPGIDQMVKIEKVPV